MMKNILSALILVLIGTGPLLGQTKWSGPFTLKVTIEGSEDSVGLFYYDMVQKKQVSEHLKLQQGVAVFEGNIGEPAIGTLYMGGSFVKRGPGRDSSLRIYLQTGEMAVKGQKTLKDAAITGAPITADFAASEAEMAPYRVDSLNTRLKLDIMPGIIRKYRNSPVGAYQLNNLLYINYRGDMDTTVIVPLFQQLSPDVRELLVAKFIGDRIDRVRKANQMTGTAAPDFGRPDINGKQLHLSDFKGEYVLVDFWGSWCRPCRQSHPHLRRLYAKYKGKGFEIIGVDQEMVGDIETMKKKWRQAVNEDSLTWVQVLNAEGIKDFDIVQAYGVEAFPTKVLLDREGRIIARFVGDDPLPIDEKLDQLFDK